MFTRPEITGKKREHYVNKLIVPLSLQLSCTLIGTVNDQQYFSIALTHWVCSRMKRLNGAVYGATVVLMWTMSVRFRLTSFFSIQDLCHYLYPTLISFILFFLTALPFDIGFIYIIKHNHLNV